MYLVHFQSARVPIELLLGTPSEAAYKTENTYVTAASKHMWQAYMLVHEQLQAGFERAKWRYDERVKSTKFSVGQFVWHFILRLQKGLNCKWMFASKGPYCTYRIKRHTNDVNFELKGPPKVKEEIMHID